VWRRTTLEPLGPPVAPGYHAGGGQLPSTSARVPRRSSAVAAGLPFLTVSAPAGRSGSALMVSLLESAGGGRRFEPPAFVEDAGPAGFRGQPLAVHGGVRHGYGVALRSLDS